MRVPVAPPPGLVSDETTFSTPGRWADGRNVRFKEGKPEPVGGWAKAFDTALTGVCRNAMAWIDQTSQLNVAFGTNSKLYVRKGEVLADITPSGLAAGNVDRSELGFGQGPFGLGPFGGGPTAEFYPRTWSLATFGQYLMASPRGRTLYVWQNNTSSLATIVTQAPDHIQCMLVTPQRTVMAFGCEQENNTYNPMCIRWCDFEDYTDWTSASGNNAGEYVLEGGGRIVGAELLGSYIAIWTDTALFLGQYTGTEDIYRFDLVADNCGLAGPNAVAIVNQVAYWLTPDLQFYTYQVGIPPAPIKCPILRDFAENIEVEQIDKVCSTSVSQFSEVWWWYPDTRDGIENSRYLSLVLSDGSWSRGDIARTAAIDSGPQQYPIYVTVGGVVYYHENGESADGAALDGFIRSSDQYLDQAENRLLVRGIWPDFGAQQGNISLTLRYRAHPAATERTKGPFTLEPGRSKKDFLADGRIFSMEFGWSAAPSFWRYGQPTFDAVTTGAQ